MKQHLKKVSLLLIVSFLTLPAFSQEAEEVSTTPSDKFSQFAIGVEILGAGLLASGLASFRPIKNLSLNLGFSSISTTATSTTGSVTSTLTILPLYASYLLGSGNHHFEVLAGADIVIGSVTGSVSGNTATLSAGGAVPIVGGGYNYWPNDGGFYFRATGYYFISSSASLAWFGVTLGYAFG